jgi:hypothetical protein
MGSLCLKLLCGGKTYATVAASNHYYLPVESAHNVAPL